MKRQEFLAKAQTLRPPEARPRRDRRCNEKGCVWPVYECGKCLAHLREMSQESSYLQPPTTAEYESGPLQHQEFSSMRTTW